MSLRKNTGKKTLEPVGLSSLEEGQLINGTVTKMEAYGAFIRIEGSNTSGLCHKSEVSTMGSLMPCLMTFQVMSPF